MRHPHHAVCGIVPPHILRRLAEHGDEEQRDSAHEALEMSSQIRGERYALTAAETALIPAVRKLRSVFDAKNKRTVPGTLIRVEGGKAVKDEAANEAYDGAGKTCDFYSKVLGRNSIDDKGARLISSVHFGVKYNNALWNGKQMVYGDGDGKVFQSFTKSLDVMGHEITHGVTQFTAKLEYHDQSGALNEHFSDVFGILVRQYWQKQKAKDADWLLARIFTPKVKGLAVRSMKAPGTAYDDKVLGKDPQPAHMKNYVKGRFDSGGVHINSGIPNHAFYLVSVAIGGNAWETAGKIWYLTLTKKLKPTAQFQDCADATYQAAAELFGKGSEPQQAVLEGWKGVGVNVSPRLVAGETARLPIKKPAQEQFEPEVAAAEVPMDEATTRRPARRSASRR